jgi:hypothetical protein
MTNIVIMIIATLDVNLLSCNHVYHGNSGVVKNEGLMNKHWAMKAYKESGKIALYGILNLSVRCSFRNHLHVPMTE